MSGPTRTTDCPSCGADQAKECSRTGNVPPDDCLLRVKRQPPLQTTAPDAGAACPQAVEDVWGTLEGAFARVRSKARGRTRCEGQKPYDDELMLAEVERLRSLVKQLDTERAAWKRWTKQAEMRSQTTEPCRFNWNGADHSECPRCAGSGVERPPTTDERARYILHRAPMATERFMQLNGCARPCGDVTCPCAVSGMVAALTEEIDHE